MPGGTENPPSSTFSRPDFRRIRSYLWRLPLATRVLIVVFIAAFVAQTFAPWITTSFALTPMELSLATLSRCNTFPFLHLSIWHLAFNLFALIPLLERFEAENGTIVTFALFTGPFGLLPALLYTFIERFILQHNSSAIGASVWVFLLLAVESMKTYRSNPYFEISTYKVPTWTTPLILMFVIAFLVPHTSLLGHLCGAAVGYGWGLGWIRFLAPSEKILRWLEGKLNLLGRLPHYVSVDQKTYGRYGVLPSTSSPRTGPGRGTLGVANGVALGPQGVGQRLGP
ncbi:hypothetical protein K431DRAFT_219936 [Polychaeton citri CBS 116435]|uniref:rhomboid protease n=1 Tax=Polychaeton citri CBS 116435 TaxID=1314669 RepID=A0A9P4QBR1_9PEZI|nr:hypothetical protein K431DRAFT_219936 [Polychaeton citri CBS 116435]